MISRRIFNKNIIKKHMTDETDKKTIETEISELKMAIDLMN